MPQPTGPQFRKIIQDFANSYIDPNDLTEMDENHPAHSSFTKEGLPVRAFESGDVARGHCIGAACALNRALESHGVQPRKITYQGPRGYYNRFDTRGVIHDVTEVDIEGSPTVVDFTHRQFDPKAEFPVVESREAFDQRMKSRRFTPSEVQRSGEGNW